MIISLVVVALAFVWLLYESDWMRIRLPVGALPINEPIKTIKLNYMVDTMYGKHEGSSRTYKQTLIYQESSSYYDKARRMYLAVGIEEPVCGWDWILNHEHPIVKNTISITAWNCKHTINLCDNPEVDYGRIIKDVCSIAFKPNLRKNGHKPKHKKGKTFNPNYKLVRA